MGEGEEGGEARPRTKTNAALRISSHVSGLLEGPGAAHVVHRVAADGRAVVAVPHPRAPFVHVRAQVRQRAACHDFKAMSRSQRREETNTG